MDQNVRDRFILLWNRYFTGAELPITFAYTDQEPTAGNAPTTGGPHRCIMAELKRVRRGTPLLLNADTIGCFGGKRYAGFRTELMPNFEYFLSCGIPGKLEGERYKKSPELVKAFLADMPDFQAPKQAIAFKRWDALEASDRPEVVIFFATPDVLAGLFTLCGFDETDRQAVIAPFGAGCATIIAYPYLEIGKDRPKGVLGMFDVSARPFVPENALSFAVPMSKFTRMVENMEESFLTTKSWKLVLKRIQRAE